MSNFLSDPIVLDVPTLYCPVPATVVPDEVVFEERGLSWMKQFGFGQDDAEWRRIVGFNSGEYLARIFPRADADRVQLFVDWTNLFFAMDDIVGDEGGLATDPGGFADLAARTVRTMEVPDADLLPAGIPFSDAVRDLTLRTRELSTPGQFRRFAEAHRAWWSGTLWQMGMKESGRVPTLNEYVALRPLDDGSAPSAVLVEITAAPRLDAADLETPLMRAVIESWGLVVGVHNDLASYGKELWFARRYDGAAKPFPANVVDLLMRSRSCSLGEALGLAAELADQTMHVFMCLCEQIRESASAPMHALLDGLADAVRGTLDYYGSPGTQRYTNPDGSSPGAVRVGLTLTDRPSAAALTVPQLPSIAWWWELAGL
ncbi:hypothetical protein ACFXPM_31755 [Streptomyces sp. NPDC059095]|uniref:terpene synthase family protein n=1 Tax=Streptomyces sp. NPDC059095 TaxID=3346726 RepID=UPI00368D2271